MKRLFLIDASALIFRAYYAFIKRPMRNRAGMNTSAVFGFVKFLNDIISRENPDLIGIAFDPRGGSFRRELDPNYKAQRTATPEDIIAAIPYIKRIAEAMRIPVLEVAGFEADDVIGTLAEQAAGEGFEVLMVSPDKDFGQLITDHISQYRLGKGDTVEIIGRQELCDKYGIAEPALVRDILALWGDASDNIPGVAGIGEKGATKLVGEWGSVDNIIANAASLPDRQREAILASTDQIYRSKMLATIRTDVPIGFTASDFKRREADTEALRAVYAELDFRSLIAALGGGVAAKPAPVTMPDLFSDAPVEVADRTVEPIIGDETIGYDLKNTIKALRQTGGEPTGTKYDLLLLAYILDPEAQNSLARLAHNIMGRGVESRDDLRTLRDSLWEQITAQGLTELYLQIEEPLIDVLADMELAGVKLDTAQLAELAKDMNAQLARMESEIRNLAEDWSLNINSSQQLGIVLFEKLRLDPKPRKTKTGRYSTDEEYLQSLADRSPIIDMILEYRGLKKLLSTYIEALPALVSTRDGRIHTTFNQAVTATGRLSSTNPNLQNIPVRTEQGRQIRRAFVPGDDDHLLLSADYSQVELRIMAHLSGDEALIGAFWGGEDIHAATAGRLFGVPIAEVTTEQRRRAKTANFGIIYGISAFGLRQRMGSDLSLAEARAIIEGYFSAYPAVHRYIDGVIASARTCGYVETIFGRRRYLPDIRSGNQVVRSLAERNAVNAPIQGSAADIIKLAMNGVRREFLARGIRSKLILQVHDELVIDVLRSELDSVKSIVRSCMEGAVQLRVPLTVDMGVGKNWLDAH